MVRDVHASDWVPTAESRCSRSGQGPFRWLSGRCVGSLLRAVESARSCGRGSPTRPGRAALLKPRLIGLRMQDREWSCIPERASDLEGREPSQIRCLSGSREGVAAGLRCRGRARARGPDAPLARAQRHRRSGERPGLIARASLSSDTTKETTTARQSWIEQRLRRTSRHGHEFRGRMPLHR